MITKSVNAGFRSETTINTFSDHDGSPGRLGLPCRPLATPHTVVPRKAVAASGDAPRFIVDGGPRHAAGPNSPASTGNGGVSL
jgi:hypothetical protein